MVEMGERNGGMAIKAVSVILQVLASSWKRKMTIERHREALPIKA